MKTNEYVKFMTKTIVQYMDQPREDRKNYRQKKKQLKEPFTLKWFGLFSYVFILLLRKKR